MFGHRSCETYALTHLARQNSALCCFEKSALVSICENFRLSKVNACDYIIVGTEKSQAEGEKPSDHEKLCGRLPHNFCEPFQIYHFCGQIVNPVGRIVNNLTFCMAAVLPPNNLIIIAWNKVKTPSGGNFRPTG